MADKPRKKAAARRRKTTPTASRKRPKAGALEEAKPGTLTLSPELAGEVRRVAAAAQVPEKGLKAAMAAQLDKLFAGKVWDTYTEAKAQEIAAATSGDAKG